MTGTPALEETSPSAETRPHRWEYVIAFLIGAGAMAFVQSRSSQFAGNDSYYHLRMARLLPTWGFTQTFPWLHWTIFRDAFVSHHHGFHVLLAPFVWASEKLTGDLLLGGKIFTMLAMGATAATLNALLVTLRVRYRLWWIIAICILPIHFWLRMAYVRAPIVALPLMLGAILFILQNRPVLLGVLAFVFAEVYGGIVLFPLIPLAFFGGHLVTGSLRREHLKVYAAALIGLGVGLVIHPYFPGNFDFLRIQVFQSGLGAPEYVGGEWKPYVHGYLLQISIPIAVIWLFSLIGMLWGERRFDGQRVALLFLNLAFLVLTIKSRRFIEYWPIFALLNAAEFTSHRGPTVVETEADTRGNTLFLKIAQGALAIVLVLVAGQNLWAARKQIGPNRDLVTLGAAMNWLHANSRQGSLVFTDDWDIFPEMFYFNQYNYYSVGLDPIFTQSIYPELWQRYTFITRGQTPRDMATPNGSVRVSLSDIGNLFHADYVIVADDHWDLYKQLRWARGEFEQIYPPLAEQKTRQPPFAIFRVLGTAKQSQREATPTSMPQSMPTTQ